MTNQIKLVFVSNLDILESYEIKFRFRIWEFNLCKNHEFPIIRNDIFLSSIAK